MTSGLTSEWEDGEEVPAVARLMGAGLRQLMNELLATPTHLRDETIREARFGNLDLAELLVGESERFEEALVPWT